MEDLNARVLGPHGAEREDERPDAAFYQQPRQVAHLDDGARAAVTAAWREIVFAGARVLDLMSSRYSHLPEDIALGEVVGLGMNTAELLANPQLRRRVIQNLNQHPQLPFADGSFDAVVNTVSTQYLTRPVTVFAEVARVLAPGGWHAVAFSNRMFPTKAIRAWRERDDAGHIALVRSYFTLAGGYDAPEVISHPGGRGFREAADPLFIVRARRAAATTP